MFALTYVRSVCCPRVNSQVVNVVAGGQLEENKFGNASSSRSAFLSRKLFFMISPGRCELITAGG